MTRQQIICSPFFKKGFLILGLFFGSFIMWAVFVPLDEGVPMPGIVTIDTKRKAVQHPSGGVIKEIFVREGQIVNKGDPLLKLGDATLKNELEIEKNNINGLRESIASLMTTEDNYRSYLKSRNVQKDLVMEELRGIKDLVDEGYAPRVNQLELERSLNQIDSEITQTQNNIKKTKNSLGELRFKLNGAQEKIPIIERKIKSTLLTANVSGQIVGLQKQSVGGVIQPAEKIMDVIPENEKLVIEAQVPPITIDRVAIEDPVDLRFASFSKSPMLVVQGKIISISKDILGDDRSQSPYYLARIILTDSGENKLGNRKLQPGMQVQVIIKTGKRTLLSYIVHPLTRRIASSMMEE